MRHIEAYADGGDAYERGEPGQPPATIPRGRKDAWLKGWAEQKAFLERQATGAAADAPRPLPAPRGCLWPLGERPFTQCGAPVQKRSPYCEAHTRIAWYRPTARLRGE